MNDYIDRIRHHCHTFALKRNTFLRVRIREQREAKSEIYFRAWELVLMDEGGTV
ncbi:hypothetical protein TorRG33x02_329300 [Trema orientale]|uniref:Uncharacterized protein n=1 Tax=Trema orientale TaxID=63057 RepID=A0A2P5B8R7_TREOI|nr:hypothetical protein TorRG33x02_329300 [Trema orientale]